MANVYPGVPGHEIVGRVVKVGSAVRRFQDGDLATVGCMVIPAAGASVVLRARLHGRIDVLINNAGLKLMAAPPSAYHSITGVSYCGGAWKRPTYAAFPMMCPSIAFIKSSRVVLAGRSSLVSRA